MKTRFWLLFLPFIVTALPLAWGATAVIGQPPISADISEPGETLIYINRNIEGVINTSHLSVLGPDTCSALGDPFSPYAPNWSPPEESALYNGLYTYTFHIRIPGAYPHDIVRVELLDPDSMNIANNNGGSYVAAVSHIQAWIDSGRPPVETLSCIASRQNPCLIDTMEDEQMGLPLDQVNLWWFIRIDENRTPAPTCSAPGNYTANYNTQTIYKLSYDQELGNGVITRTALARYTGQTGDNVRDLGDHMTDMHWVSPGAPMSFDQPANVPTSGPNAYPDDFGSFELSLSADLADIVVDPLTGDRTIYLDVTGFTGSSENGFMVWAGPPDYIYTVSSNVNIRNVQIINSPGSHSADGVEVLAVNTLPVNSDYLASVDIPLIYLGPEYAGQEVYVRLFDSDAGSQPPITFFLDTVAEADWSMVFAASSNPTDDPDHDPVTYPVNGRCRPGSCNNLWVRPAYKLTIPTYDADACAIDLGNQYVCTPFYGGRLIARYRSGMSDSYAWQITAPAVPPVDNARSCAAFPLALYTGIRSVTEAEFNALNFSYPTNPPSYHSFIHHQPNLTLESAGPGTVFVYRFDSVQAAWLKWNSGIASGATTLADSLVWPGNSSDYTDHSDSGVPIPPFDHVVRGFIEVGDSTDLTLNISDRVTSNEIAALSDAVPGLQAHTLNHRLLRLPLLDNTAEQYLNGIPYYQPTGFGVFRVVGYGVNQNWVLLEFQGFETSCGQTAIPLETVGVTGTAAGHTDQNHEFTAAVAPISATLPVTFTWQASDHSPIVHVNFLTDAIDFTWASTGLKTITVTAANRYNQVTATHAITITAPPITDLTIGPVELVSTPPITAYTPITFRATISNTGNQDVNGLFFVDLFINPSIVLSDSIPINQSSGYTAVNGLTTGATRVLTITSYLGFPTEPPTHTVYAMVDSLQQITETDENNNISSPLSVTGILPPSPQIALTPNCSNAGPTIELHVTGYYWPLGEIIAIFWNAQLIQQVVPQDHSFSLHWIRTNPGSGVHEIRAISASHEATAVFTVPCSFQSPSRITLSGATAGHVGELLTFTANVLPGTATYPITYTWQIDDQPPITHTNWISDALTTSWTEAGTHILLVTATNAHSHPVGNRHVVVINDWKAYLPFVVYEIPTGLNTEVKLTKPARPTGLSSVSSVP
jgi:hypothetical protein